MRVGLVACALVVVGAPLLWFSACSSPEAEQPSPPNPLSLKGEGESETEPEAGAEGFKAATDTLTGEGDELKGEGEGTREPEVASSLPARYPPGELHSPMSKSVVDRLKAVLASSKGRPGVVAKVGDSLTVNSYFLGCFAGSDVRLGAYADLEPTRAFFSATPADPTHSSFARYTLAAKVCWSSMDVVAGSPSPLDQEITAITPGFAVVLIGTNDTYPQGPELLDKKLLRIVDVSLNRGVIPILTTLPQRTDTSEAEALVPEMNAVIRAIAQARQVPLMDLFAALADIPDHGLARDGVHLATFMAGIARGCWFDDQALQKGINRRNLLTLTSLDRIRRFLIESEAPEPAPPALEGEGTWQSPYDIDALPFVDDRDPLKIGVSERSTYDCSAADEGGPEVVYRITLTEPTTLRARLFHGPDADMDLHFLAGPGSASTCLHRADKVLDVTAGPGTYWLSVDSYAGNGEAHPGDYRLTVVRSQ